MAEEHIDTAGRRRIKEDLRVAYMSGEVPHRLSLAHLHVAIGCVAPILLTVLLVCQIRLVLVKAEY
jgi:hypothetical protein